MREGDFGDQSIAPDSGQLNDGQTWSKLRPSAWGTSVSQSSNGDNLIAHTAKEDANVVMHGEGPSVLDPWSR